MRRSIWCAICTFLYIHGIYYLLCFLVTVIFGWTALESDRDEDFSEKLIAFARYNRNITLIKEILSDVVMPVFILIFLAFESTFM